ncbi:hypothetical protein RGL65_001398 [Vibrio parahaemolyticus]|nr:hypothetical protein [Vibrio parahaemolyticus]
MKLHKQYTKEPQSAQLKGLLYTALNNQKLSAEMEGAVLFNRGFAVHHDYSSEEQSLSQCKEQSKKEKTLLTLVFSKVVFEYALFALTYWLLIENVKFSNEQPPLATIALLVCLMFATGSAFIQVMFARFDSKHRGLFHRPFGFGITFDALAKELKNTSKISCLEKKEAFYLETCQYLANNKNVALFIENNMQKLFGNEKAYAEKLISLRK